MSTLRYYFDSARHHGISLVTYLPLSFVLRNSAERPTPFPQLLRLCLNREAGITTLDAASPATSIRIFGRVFNRSRFALSFILPTIGCCLRQRTWVIAIRAIFRAFLILRLCNLAALRSVAR